MEIPAETPRKPLYGAPCNSCGLCCVATACELAMNWVPRAKEGEPCPALEWEDGRSRCGLILRPLHHAPILRLAAGPCELGAEVGELLVRLEVARCLGVLEEGTCDSGPRADEGPDPELGQTVAVYLAERAAARARLRRWDF